MNTYTALLVQVKPVIAAGFTEVFARSEMVVGRVAAKVARTVVMMNEGCILILLNEVRCVIWSVRWKSIGKE